MVSEPEMRLFTTVCSIRVFSFQLNAGSLPAVPSELLSDIRSSSLECGFVCLRLRADQREAGLRRGAERFWFFLS